MKSIYRALRALREYPNYALPREATSLAQALASFERAHRGHQSELDTLAAAICTRTAQPAEVISRMERLRDSLVFLLETAVEAPAAALTAPRATLPALDALNAFWTEPDSSGVLEVCALQAMRRFVLYRMNVPSGYETALVSLEVRGGQLCWEFSVVHKTTRLRAWRTLTFNILGLHTLLACVSTLREFCRQATEGIASVAAWPEFTPSRQDNAMTTTCECKLKDFLASCTPEQRQWYSTNWHRLASAPGA